MSHRIRQKRKCSLLTKHCNSVKNLSILLQYIVISFLDVLEMYSLENGIGHLDHLSIANLGPYIFQNLLACIELCKDVIKLVLYVINWIVDVLAFLDVVAYSVLFLGKTFPDVNLGFVSIADLVNFVYAQLIWEIAFLFELFLAFGVILFELLVDRCAFFGKTNSKEAALFMWVKKLRWSDFDNYFHFFGLI